MKPTARSTLKTWRLRPLCLAVCLSGLHLGTGAAPQGAHIVFGQVQLQGSTNRLDIKQSSDKAIIDWKSFSLQTGELLRIEQPSATAVLLNRVVGSDPSLILGRIEANGRVFLTNPRGILFGSSSQVDAGSFLATTLSLSNDNFLAGRYQLSADPGSTPGKLQADGQITAANGTIALVAPELSVGGSLQAQRVGLAAVGSVLVDVEGDGLILFNARNDGLQARLDLLGTVRADGGTAELRAQARAGFADTVLNLDGIVQARSIGRRNGQVVIDGGSDGITAVTGQVDVSGRGEGETGGSASVFGRYVGLLGHASIDASGTNGGGSILVGGNFHGEGAPHNALRTSLGADTRLRADAVAVGDGGRIAVWSDEATRFFGSLSARGGQTGGDGGFAEVSGKQFLDFRGFADLAAPRGRVGSLLLDPVNLTISAGPADINGDGTLTDDLITPGLSWDAPGAESVITASAVKSQLNSANVVLEASNNITITSAIDGASNANTHSLTLNAGNDIIVGANISTKGDLTLSANHTFSSAGGSAASGVGVITVDNVSVSATGGGHLVLTGTGISATASTALAGQNVTLQADALALPTITAGGTISATANTGSITQTGVLTAGADGSSFSATTAGQTILLTGANLFGGKSVALQSAGDASITSDALKFGDSSIGGKLTAVASTGAITQTAATHLNLGADGSSFTTSTANQAITLSEANVLNGKTVALNTSGSGDASLSADAIQFDGSTIGGKLVAVASGGGITQTAATQLNLGADGNSFTTSTANQTITLSEANVLNGKTVVLNTSGTGDASLTADALKFGTSSLGGKLTAIASTGGITQTGALTTGATGSSFTVSTTGQSIDLSTQANSLAGLANGTDSFSTQGDLGLRNLAGIQIGATTVSGKLVLVSDQGAITQVGALNVGADGSSFTTSTAGQAVTLTAANVFNGKTVAVHSAGDASLGGDALKFDASTVAGKLIATADTGAITQTAALNLGADGNSFTTSTAGQAITLTAANVLNGKTVALNTSGTGDASLTADAIKFDAGTIGGKLVATASTGAITQTGALNLGADGNSFTTSAAGQTITLTAANVLNGKTVALSTSGAAGDASLTADSLAFDATTIGGKLVATTNTGSITQAGALNLGADGNSFDSAQAITLTSANVLNGKTVALSSIGDASLTADAIQFNGSTIGGKLVATASTGTITQTGALNLGADGNSFSTSTANQAITLTNANILNGKTVALNTSGTANASFTADALKFGTSSLGGKLTAIASTGGITQTGALTTGATGSSFTVSTAGQSIDLSTQANSLAGLANGTDSFITQGDLGLRNLAGIQIGATTVSGKLVLVSDQGAITQVGALNVGADGSSFTTSTASQAVTLTAANVFNGKTVAVHSAGDASLSGDALTFDASTVAGKLIATADTGTITQNAALNLGADGNSFSTSTAGQAITLTAANLLNGKTVALTSGGDASLTADAIKFDASTIGGKLVASASTGAIMQTGALNLGADGNSFTTSTAGQTITLTAANVLNGKTVALSTSGAAGDASLTADSLAFDATTIGGKLVATTSAGSITQAGALNLGADGNSFNSAQAITLTSANVLNGKTVALTSVGDAALTADSLKLAASTIGGKLVATASTGTITQTGPLNLGADGNSFNSAQAITLTSANVLNGKTVALTSVGDAALTADALKLAASTLGGKLVATASTGTITQTGALNLGADGNSFSTSTANQAITLSEANVLNGKTVALNTSGTANASFTADALKFGTSSLGGKLTAIASTGGITQTGALTTGATGSSFTVSTAGQSIDLSTQANSLAGLANGTDLFSTQGDLGLRNLAGIQIGATTVSGKLVLVSDQGAITQVGALNVGADGSSFTTSTASQAVTLTAANVFNGKTVAVHSAGDASLSGDALKFAASSTAGKLVAHANTGTITQTGALDLGADGNSFSTAAGQAITLGSANVFNGKTVAITSGADATVTADALKFAASTVAGKLVATTNTGSITQTGALNLGADGNSFDSAQGITLTSANILNGKTVALASVGDASITAGALKFDASTIGGKLVASASTGAITQTGVLNLGADGNSFSTAAGQAINLGSANVFNGKTVAITSGADATVTADALTFAASTVAGKLVATSNTGSITQAGALNLGADGNSFNSAQAITLTSANVLNGKTVALTSVGDAALTADALKLAASTLGGKLVATASTGTITQTGALNLGADGNSFNAAQAITLTSANVLHGKTVAVTSGGDTALTADALKFNASTFGGKLTAVASTGGISQVGALSLGADGSSFTSSGAGQNLNLGSSNNVFNGKTVSLSSAGDAALKADAIRLAGANAAGKLVLEATTGGITQTGAFTVGADGSSFTTDTAGQAITLTAANVFSGKTVALHSAGDASLNADALKFAASTVAGKLVATASTGAITQTGALDLGADGSSFTTSTANQAITLTAANGFNGKTVALHSAGNASLAADALKLAASTVSGSLDLSATASITQAGALTVGGLTRLTALGNTSTVTLADAGNQFAGGVQLASAGATPLQSVNLASASALSVAGDAAQLSLGSANALVLGGGAYGQLSLSAGTGVSQLGAITVTGPLTIAATGAGPLNVDLRSNGAGNELSSVQLSAGGAGFGTVQVQDRDQRADGLLFTGDAQTVKLVVQGGVTMAGGSYGGLSIDSSGNNGLIQQTGALRVSGLTELNSGAGDVLLTQAANDFSDVALIAARNASLRDANDLRLTQGQISSSLTLDAPGTVRLAGGLSGAGTLVKNGSGVLLIDSGLTNTGGTLLQQGSLVLQGPAAHLGAGQLTLSAAATLDLRDGAAFSNALLSQGGLIRSSSGSNTLDGAVTLAADTVVDVQAGASLRLLGAVGEQGGAQSLNKQGEGLLQLSGTDSRSGATRIVQGQVLADGTGSLSALSAVDVASGARLTLGRDESVGSLSGGGQVELAAFRLASGGDQQSSEFSGRLSGTGGLSKTGNGTLTLSGTNTQTGATQVNGGTLLLAQGSAQADNAALSVASGATLVLAADETIGGLSGLGAVQLGGKRLTVGADGADSSFGGSIGGSGALSKTGAGALTLSGSGSWDGETRVDAGRLVLASSTALPTGNTLALATGAVLELRNAFTLSALNGAGTVQLNANELTLGANDAGSQFAGVLSGSGGLSKIGGGTVQLTGANTFTGPVAVKGGGLSLSGGVALADSVAVNLAAGTTLALQSGETLARVTGSGAVQLNNASRLALGGDGADSLFAGQIGGSGGLAKQGAGTLTLTGGNSYSGSTVIEAGTVQVGNGGTNATSGNLGTGAVDNRGLLRFARSDDVQLDNTLSGTGALELAQGRLTLTNAANNYSGATTVTAGELLTRGAERLSDASAVKVAAGGRLTVDGNETVASLVADGAVLLRGNLSSSGEQRYRGGLTIESATGIKLQGTAVEALNTANKLGSQALSITADTVQLLAPQDLTLGAVQLARGGQITTEHLTLQGALSLTGGSLSLTARAAPDDAKAQASATAFVPGTGKPLALAQETVVQSAGSTLNIASGADLRVSALGSVNFAQDANVVAGSISVLSGAAFNTAWVPNVKGTVAIQGAVKLAGQQLNIGGAGVEADIVELRAGQLATLGDARLAARLPFDNVLLGTNLSQPSMVIELLPSAYATQFSFGSSTSGVRVSVGAREIGGRTDGPDSGYLTIRPKDGAKGATAIFLLGPDVMSGAGYSFFHDGAGKQTEIPVFYNNVLPSVPQVASALSSVAAVSESARRDRFEEAVRTENVTSRLRAGVIAEVGPGRAATVGAGAAMPPLSCTPKENSLGCTP